MVLEFPTQDAYLRFERQMMQDTHEVATFIDPPPAKALGRTIKYAGVSLVLCIRA
jgi:hypothetical protein